jgi:hypothetical protein
VVRLTPYGLFAIAATATGTLNLEQVGRLQVYLVSYVVVALLVALWVLPGLVAALTPIRVRDILRLTRDALITAFVSGDLFIVLPVLIDASKTLIDRHHLADRQAVASWEQIRARGGITLLVPNETYYIDKVQERAPRAKLQKFQDASSVFAKPPGPFDAIVMPAERGSAWTLIHPQYTIVVPEPGIVKMPLAYPLAGQDQAFASFINTWIELKRKDGTIDALYKYWILGQNATPRQPRWSIIRNVLGWVE